MITANKGKMLVNQRIGFRLKIAREAQFYTQAEMAKALGVSQGRYSMYETGQRTLDHEIAANFVKIVEIDFNFLFGGSPRSIANKQLKSRLRKAHALFRATVKFDPLVEADSED